VEPGVNRHSVPKGVVAERVGWRGQGIPRLHHLFRTLVLHDGDQTQVSLLPFRQNREALIQVLSLAFSADRQSRFQDHVPKYVIVVGAAVVQIILDQEHPDHMAPRDVGFKTDFEIDIRIERV